MLKTKLSPVTCHHMDNITIPLKHLVYKCLRYFYVSPKSAVFVPESAVFPTYDLEVSNIFRNFAKTMEVFLRVWAAAQQSSSELGSAFALHHPCTCKRNTANTGKTASTPTLSSPITLQLPSHRSPCRPSPVARHPLLSILYNHI